MPVAYEPIRHYRTRGEGWPAMAHPLEAAARTFKTGVPIVISAGYAQEAAFAAPEIVYGVSAEPGHNLTTAGTPQEGVSVETPPNQPLAKTVLVGSPLQLGHLLVYKADGNNEFTAMLKDGQTFSTANLNVAYGLTKDASGFWYIDTADVTGDNVVAVVRGLDGTSPNTAAGGARVIFTFVPALRAW